MMIVVLLSLVVVLTLLEPLSSAPALPAWWAGPAVAAYLVLAAGIAAGHTAWTVRTAADGALLSRRALKRRHLAGLGGQVYLVGGLAGVLLAGYRTAIMTCPTVTAVPLLPVLLAWAPFVAALLITWVLEYPLYRAVRLRSTALAGAGAPALRVWTLREFVAYNLRHHVLFVAVPVGLIIFIGDALHLWLGPLLPEAVADVVVLAGSLVGTGAVFVIAPAMIVRIWRTSPLPPDRLREELEGLCRRLRLRYRDILIWHSGGAIANAAMMGLIGPIRYVLISDALLDNLDRRCVRAIFAHEAGHIRHHHIFYSVLFGLAAAGLCGAVAQQAAVWMGGGDEAATGLMVVLLAAAWAGGFGWISRRFERQSDVMGVCLAGEDASPQAPPQDASGPGDLAVSPEGVAVFCHALHRVAQLNGISPVQRNWRHGSVASRIAYLMSPRAPDGPGQAIDRQVRLIKVALWLALGVAAAANVVQYFWLSPSGGPA
ncbi:MAG: M48 family metallopeptidase [Phycisphaerae bacterium]|nr:M48 family metallopeptidase [Phycisphaerae bacterium]